ncbi:MAG TPA: twin-arginine translocation signal domain-containing protein, partial [Candidatus Paceibacterota bacterium]|nr:twin-arginine translocation signal domain-containing protein [Candidatus Paceibacterota bacterium]
MKTKETFVSRRDFIKTSALVAGAGLSAPWLTSCSSLSGSASVKPISGPFEPNWESLENWKLASATEAPSDGAAISVAGYRDSRWHPIHRMPATVLEILEEDGVYSNLYFGKNLAEKVPQDLWKQDWWYRTTFKAPAGEAYTLEFPGINYRAEIWLNGKMIADNKQIVGMYAAHEL